MNSNVRQKTVLKYAQKTGITLGIPLVVLSIFLIACAAKGAPFWAADGGARAFVYAVATAIFSTFALGLHFFAGRFDFSLGSILVLTGIIGGKIAIGLNTGTFAMLPVFLTVGVVLGAVSGVVYLIFNLPPIITSLGVALAYEGIGFALTNGKGVQIGLYPALLGGAEILPMALLVIAGVAVLFVLFNFTRYGYTYRAIQFGQKISVETGLNEKSNAFICYAICGSLMAVVAYLNISYSGIITPLINLTSSTSIFGVMLPLFIGGIIARYCEQNIAIVIGCITAALVTQGLLSLGVTAQQRSLINSLLTIIILAYSIHGERLKKKIKHLSAHSKGKKKAFAAV